jgi:hypothetical protein
MSIQENIEFLREYCNNLPEFSPPKYYSKKQTIEFYNEYNYMIEHALKYVKLLQKYEILDKITISAHFINSKFTGIDFDLSIGEFTANCYCSTLCVFVGISETKTFICNGFTYHNSKKQYFGKQFINMINQYILICKYAQLGSQGIKNKRYFIENNFVAI